MSPIDQVEVSAVDAMRLREARQIQLSLLPWSTKVRGLDTAFDFQPSTTVGGDYVDIAALPGGRVLLVVADVSGCGLPAALTSLSLHSMVHISLRLGVSLEPMMATLNAHLCEFLREGSFVTMLAVQIDPVGGGYTCVNAGHLPPMIAEPGGAVHRLEAGLNLPMGLEPTRPVAQRGTLNRGATMALVTDGITEMSLAGGGLLGCDGFCDSLSATVVEANGEKCSDLMVKLTRRLTDRASHDLARDDWTMLLARR